MVRRLTWAFGSSAGSLTGTQIHEDRLEVWLDRGQLKDVQALIGQQPRNHRKIELVVSQADLDNAVGEWLHPETRCGEYLRGPQVVRHSDPRRKLSARCEDVPDVAFGEQPATADDRDRVGDLLYFTQNVAGYEHRLPPADHAAHHGADLLSTGRVEAVGRLVEDQQLRVFQQRCGDGKALLHAKRVV